MRWEGRAMRGCPCDDGLYCPVHYREPDPRLQRLMAIDSYLRRSWSLSLQEVRGIIGSSPLFEKGENDQPKPLVPPRLFVSGLWDVVSRHVAVYAIMALEMKSPQIVTDLELVEARYGKAQEEPFSARLARPKLLVIRLGFQLTTNSELPNLLFETLRLREANKAPVVIVNEPFTPWKAGHRAYSTEVDSYLRACFRLISIL